MPHLVLSGPLDVAGVATEMPPTVHRWRHTVLKIEDCWLRAGGGALLVEGVVVEHSRPLHPVAVVAPRHDDTIVRLWSRVAVERTHPVQRWLCVVTRELQRLGGGPVTTTNIPADLWSDLELEGLQTESR